MNEASFVPPGTPIAPAWSLLVGTIGRGGIIAAGILFTLALLASFIPKAERPARIASVLGTVGLWSALFSLGALFLTDQFQFRYIFNHSDAKNATQYKISAIWTAQEGSFLLWGAMSAFFGTWALFRAGVFARAAGAVMGVFLASICAILVYETPFALLDDVMRDGKVFMPKNGNGMTPSLQNYWVAIHPPTIFAGFGLLVVPFALGIAGVIRRDITGWVAVARPFVLWGVAILGLGISMGGLWAYETQGWGGFWAWDPVENVSLVPWLFLVALSHGMIVQARTPRGALMTAILAGIPFLTFVYGTFLTRSGLLDKVSNHSFASMDKAALQVLRGMLVVFALGYVAYAVRTFKLAKAFAAPAGETPERGYDKTQAYASGVTLLSLIAVVVSVGMSWPVVTNLVTKKDGSRVEEPLYHQALVWFFIPLLILMAVSPFMSWKRDSAKEIWKRVMNSFSLSLAGLGLALIAMKLPGSGIDLDPARTVSGPFGTSLNALLVLGLLVWLCIFVAAGNLVRIGGSLKRAKMSLGGLVSHIGIAVLLGGLILSHGLERKARVFLREGSPQQALGYNFVYKKFTGNDIYDRESKVTMDVTDPAGNTFEARPTLYYFDAPNPDGEGTKPTPNIWPHIERRLTHDVYLALKEPITEVFPEPMMLKVGETKLTESLGEEDHPDHPGHENEAKPADSERMKITYEAPTSKGQPGMVGTEFGAKVTVVYDGKVMTGNPTIQLTPEGPQPSLVQIGPDFKLAIETMNPADRSIGLKVLLSPPVYPVEVFEKPLTSLVWLGTGIFTIGGAMAAFSRRLRRPVKVIEKEPVVGPEPDSGQNKGRAPLPAPQS